MDEQSLSHTKWKCQYHIVSAEVSQKSNLQETAGGYWKDIEKAM